MTPEDVHEILAALVGLPVWLDGGWGIDALLGDQTREHSDLDIAIDADSLPAAEGRLRKLGFTHAQDEEPGMPARYVLRDGRDRQVDFHVLAFDAAGDGWQTLPDGTRGRYPRDDLGWTGTIADRTVPCISPTLQLRHHTGYEPQERDRLDMARLAERFGLELPETLEALA